MSKKIKVSDGGLSTVLDEYSFATWLDKAEVYEQVSADLETISKIWFDTESPTDEQNGTMKSIIETLNRVTIGLQLKGGKVSISPAFWQGTIEHAKDGSVDIELSIDKVFWSRLIKLGTFLLSIPNDLNSHSRFENIYKSYEQWIDESHE